MIFKDLVNEEFVRFVLLSLPTFLSKYITRFKGRLNR